MICLACDGTARLEKQVRDRSPAGLNIILCTLHLLKHDGTVDRNFEAILNNCEAKMRDFPASGGAFNEAPHQLGGGVWRHSGRLYLYNHF